MDPLQALILVGLALTTLGCLAVVAEENRRLWKMLRQTYECAFCHGALYLGMGHRCFEARAYGQPHLVDDGFDPEALS